MTRKFNLSTADYYVSLSTRRYLDWEFSQIAIDGFLTVFLQF